MLRYGEMVEEKIPGNRRWLWPAIARPPQQSKVGQWRQRMTRSQRILFEGLAGPPMRHWGSETYAQVPKSAAAYPPELWYHLHQGGRPPPLRPHPPFPPPPPPTRTRTRPGEARARS